MNTNLTELIELSFGKPLTEINAPIMYSLSDYCHKIDDHIYLLTMIFDNVPVYRGFAWMASDKAAEWIFENRWSDDAINLHPPDILLPIPGMTNYQNICELGKQLDPKYFINYVPSQRVIMFENYTYYYRKSEPHISDYPIGILIDRRPREYLNSGNNIVTFKNWTKTTNKTFIDFKNFSLNNLIGGGMNEGSFIDQLSCFGKPDAEFGSLCYFNLGLEFMLSGDQRIAYIVIYFQSNKRSINPFTEQFSVFSTFSGDLFYGERRISLSELKNCDALIQSFSDSRFKLYDTSTDRFFNRRIAYIEEVDGARKRTVVFEYKNGYIDQIILY